jgi:hypothetical protein
VNGARGTRAIEGKVTRVGASELGCERVSKPSAPVLLAASLLRILYGSEDYAVVAGAPPARLAVAARVSRACTAELQPTRLPLQSNK